MKASSLKQISRSELRHRILSSLNLEPANSVTSLAKKLDVLRPSVSRAVRSLEDAGLISRQGRVISLSRAGLEELNRLDEKLSLKVKKSTDLAGHLLNQTTETWEAIGNNSFSQLAETLANSPFLQLNERLAKGSFIQFGEMIANSPVLQAVKEFANSPALQVAHVITDYAPYKIEQAFEAISATASIQSVNLGLLQNWEQEAFSPLSHLVLENNVHLSNMMVDLEAFTKIGKAIVTQNLGSLINQASWTTRIYDTYFLDVVGNLKQIPTFDSLQLSLAIPTTGTASLIGSTRRMVESDALLQPEGEPVNLYVGRAYTSSERYVTLTPKLEVYLKPLGQRFIDKWEGAWQTLYSQGNDRHSQATHSGRELLMQVLAYLAPDSVFSKEDCAKYGVNKPTRKMRIKHIVGYSHNSAVELIDCMANTVDKMYDVLVGEAHRRDDKNYDDDTIMGQLAALGALLIMLLSMHNNIQS